ncbi:MAG: LysR family transcriptional regulator [Burkholderiales bacterium]|nr:MAG: LysR family transcriptional regulator [Burkholderiales bacterium]
MPADPPIRKNAAPVRPQLRWRLRVMCGELNAIGPGKIELLEAIQAHHSITAAAKALGMSYRRAWLLVDELNRSLKEPAVETAAGGSGGGGTALTPMGQRVLALYRGIEAQAEAACRDDIKRLLATVAREA